jgi:hypothetical protein
MRKDGDDGAAVGVGRAVGLIEPLIPKVPRRHRFPGRKRLDDRKVLSRREESFLTVVA